MKRSSPKSRWLTTLRKWKTLELSRVRVVARMRAHSARVRTPAKQHKLIDIITIAQRAIAVACLEKFPTAGNPPSGLFATEGDPPAALSHHLCRDLWC